MIGHWLTFPFPFVLSDSPGREKLFPRASIHTVALTLDALNVLPADLGAYSSLPCTGRCFQGPCSLEQPACFQQDHYGVTVTMSKAGDRPGTQASTKGEK